MAGDRTGARRRGDVRRRIGGPRQVGARGRIGGVVVAYTVLGGTPAEIGGQARPETVRAETVSSETVQAEVGGRPVSFPVVRHRAYPAVAATELALALESVLDDVTRNGVFLRARLHGEEVAFEAESPFFRRGGHVLQLANPPYAAGGAFWIPAEFVTRWVSEGPPPEDPPPEEPRPSRVDPASPWRVIIDPGHGGRDPGTLGGASYEKDVVLAIGQRLQQELGAHEMFEPHMTRETDVYLDLDARSSFAVERAGDLFVSIHANAAADEGVRGFETIFLGEARFEEAREVALRENRGLEVEEPTDSPSDRQSTRDRDLQVIHALEVGNEHLEESGRFAGFVQNSIRSTRGGGRLDRGVKQGPWWVLLGAIVRMPSVIVEVGFLSNDEEEGYLNDAEGQAAIARAIAEAIVAYRADLLRRFGPAPELGR